MNDGNLLLRVCCSCPTDRDAQLALADWLQENNEPECEESLRADAEQAAETIRTVHTLADQLRRPPCLKLLFAVVVVAPVAFIRPVRETTEVVPEHVQSPIRRPRRAERILPLIPEVPVVPGPYEVGPRWRVDYDEIQKSILRQFKKEGK